MGQDFEELGRALAHLRDQEHVAKQRWIFSDDPSAEAEYLRLQAEAHEAEQAWRQAMELTPFAQPIVVAHLPRRQRRGEGTWKAERRAACIGGPRRMRGSSRQHRSRRTVRSSARSGDGGDSSGESEPPQDGRRYLYAGAFR